MEQAQHLHLNDELAHLAFPFHWTGCLFFISDSAKRELHTRLFLSPPFGSETIFHTCRNMWWWKKTVVLLTKQRRIENRQFQEFLKSFLLFYYVFVFLSRNFNLFKSCSKRLFMKKIIATQLQSLSSGASAALMGERTRQRTQTFFLSSSDIFLSSW